MILNQCMALSYNGLLINAHLPPSLFSELVSQHAWLMIVFFFYPLIILNSIYLSL